jgi:signal peptidase II
LRRVWVIAAIIVALDQITKFLVVRCLGDAPVPILHGYFQLVNWRNTGAAWGILRNYNFVLAAISIVTLAALYFFRNTFGIQRAVAQWAFGLINGGIVGNLIDRLALGHVVDFLDFHVGEHHWPAFNVADSAICVGVFLYVIISWHHDATDAQKSKS